MAITVDDIRSSLSKLGLLETSKDPNPSSLKKGKDYFVSPSSKGKEFIVYLSDKYQKSDRKQYLTDLAQKLKSFKALYKMKVGASTAGGITFPGSQIYIIAKMFKSNAGAINKGILFEQNLEKDLKTYLSDGTNFIYKDFMKQFTASIYPDKIASIKTYGALNTSRPFGVDGQGLYVSVRGRGRSEMIGFAVVDILVITTKGRKIPLSLKYGSTVTFFNSGVSRFFNTEDFKKGDFTRDPVAKEIFNLFQLDPKLFKESFMNYVEREDGKKVVSEKHSVSVKIDKAAMKKFIKTVIGYGYTLVHEHNNGHISMHEITKDFLDKAATPDSNYITILYPKAGSAKRVDILVSTPVFNLKFNIRNKQGGILPTHMMCDYSFK
jgi:hypothetical protein